MSSLSKFINEFYNFFQKLGHFQSLAQHFTILTTFSHSEGIRNFFVQEIDQRATIKDE
jgi:hypothetical protein